MRPRSCRVVLDDNDESTTEGTVTSRTMSLGPSESSQGHETKKRSSSHLDDNDDSGLERLTQDAFAVNSASADQSRPRKSPKLSHDRTCEDSTTGSVAANRQLSVLQETLGQLQMKMYSEVENEVEEIKGRMRRITEVGKSAQLQKGLLIAMARDFFKQSGEWDKANRAALKECSDGFGARLPDDASMAMLADSVHRLLPKH